MRLIVVSCIATARSVAELRLQRKWRGHGRWTGAETPAGYDQNSLRSGVFLPLLEANYQEPYSASTVLCCPLLLLPIATARSLTPGMKHLPEITLVDNSCGEYRATHQFGRFNHRFDNVPTWLGRKRATGSKFRRACS